MKRLLIICLGRGNWLKATTKCSIKSAIISKRRRIAAVYCSSRISSRFAIWYRQTPHKKWISRIWGAIIRTIRIHRRYFRRRQPGHWRTSSLISRQGCRCHQGKRTLQISRKVTWSLICNLWVIRFPIGSRVKVRGNSFASAKLVWIRRAPVRIAKHSSRGIVWAAPNWVTPIPREPNSLTSRSIFTRSSANGDKIWKIIRISKSKTCIWKNAC